MKALIGNAQSCLWSGSIGVGILLATSVAAAECNFGKPVGACSGRIDIVSTSGKAPSFAAEVVVSSSVGSCSKVEFLLDSTPHVSVLRGGSRTDESLHGTSPISKKNLQVLSCTAFEDASAAGAKKVVNSRELGGCSPDSSEGRRLAAYNNTGDSLDSLIDFLPKAIAANRDVGDPDRAKMLSGLLDTALACKAKGG